MGKTASRTSLQARPAAYRLPVACPLILGHVPALAARLPVWKTAAPVNPYSTPLTFGVVSADILVSLNSWRTREGEIESWVTQYLEVPPGAGHAEPQASGL